MLIVAVALGTRAVVIHAEVILDRIRLVCIVYITCTNGVLCPWFFCCVHLPFERFYILS